MEIANCNFTVRGKNIKELSEGLEVLVSKTRELPISFNNAGFLNINGGDKYMRISPDSPVEISEIRVSEESKPMINGFHYKRGEISFNYDGTQVEIKIKNDERVLQDEIAYLKQRLGPNS